MEIKNPQRNNLLDITKAIAIILVIIGHSIQYGSGYNFLNNNLFFNNWLFKLIYSFHMPLFMLISGYLFYYSITHHTLKENIKNRFFTLLIPIVIWAIPSSILSIITQEHKINFLKIVKLYFSNFISNPWFLWAILLCSLSVIIAKKFFNDSILIYLIGFITTFFIPDIHNTALYKFMYPFFILGYFFNKISKKYNNILFTIIQNRLLLLCILGPIFFILLFFFDENSYIYTTGYYIFNNSNVFKQFSVDIYRFTIGLVGSLFVIIFISTVYNKLSNKVISVLTFIGKRSFGIYIISGYIFTYILPKITLNLLNINYGLITIETFLILLLSLFIIELIKKVPLLNCLLLGKR